MNRTSLGGRAIVIGSGIAGLLSARQLSPFFEEVVLVERDRIPDALSTRSGLPQGDHFHALQPGGLEIAERLFPGLSNTLAARGAIPTVGGRDFYFYQPLGKSYSLTSYVPDPVEGPLIYVQSRALLEFCIRERVEVIPNVRIDYQTTARRPIWRSDRVVGLVVAHTGESKRRSEEIDADLVVDAAGQGTRTPRWMQEKGCPLPDESVVHCDFSYTSVFVRPRDFDAFEGSGFFVFPNPDGKHPLRGSSLVKMEGGLWLASGGGRFGERPPRDWEGLLEWIRAQDNPIVADLIADADPVRKPAHFRFPSSRRRHYEGLPSFPDGLIPVGDAICHFNPLFGQGMSAAARQVQALADVLAGRAESGGGLAGAALEFFPLAFEETRAPWLFACLADFRSPQCKGDFPSEEREAMKMLGYLGRVADRDPSARKLLRQIGGMHVPLSAILTPEWIAKKSEASKAREMA